MEKRQWQRVQDSGCSAAVLLPVGGCGFKPGDLPRLTDQALQPPTPDTFRTCPEVSRNDCYKQVPAVV
jgi:hypothetical protein